MKIAVTSAGGKLGAAIVNQLTKEIGEENVIALEPTPERAGQLGVEFRKADYNQPEQLKAALAGVDEVLLVSGMDEPQKRIQQHRNVIEAAKFSGVKKIEYTSIVGDEQISAFGPVVQSNRQNEKDVQNSGLECVIGRNRIYLEPDLEY
jgi:NAD(P)H dehydrogenase (quinone)